MIPNLSDLRLQNNCLPAKENFSEILTEEVVRGEVSVAKVLQSLNDDLDFRKPQICREFCLDPYMFENYSNLFIQRDELEVIGSFNGSQQISQEKLWGAHLWLDGLWSQNFSLQNMIDFIGHFKSELSLRHLFRIGFLFQQSELYESAAMGFDGALLHVGDLDIYNLQLFTEVGRELAIHIVWICRNESEVLKVLETDCPNIALTNRFLMKSSVNSFTQIENMKNLLPQNVKPWFIANNLDKQNLDFAKQHKFARIGGQEK